jgi:hypothetical protein
MGKAKSATDKIEKAIKLSQSHNAMERTRIASTKRAAQMVKEGRI